MRVVAGLGRNTALEAREMELELSSGSKPVEGRERGVAIFGKGCRKRNSHGIVHGTRRAIDRRTGIAIFGMRQRERRAATSGAGGELEGRRRPFARQRQRSVDRPGRRQLPTCDRHGRRCRCSNRSRIFLSYVDQRNGRGRTGVRRGRGFGSQGCRLQGVEPLLEALDRRLGLFKLGPESDYLGIAILGVHARCRQDHERRRGFAGGRAFGYRKVVKLDKKGELVRGLLEISDEQSKVVRQIYREFAAGRSARDIAKRLNAEAIPSPRGGLWNQSTIRGDISKLVGILNNPLYRGQLVWNRREWRKDPDSDKRERRYRLRDESEWVSVGVPDLRIVDDDLVDAVAAELQRRKLPPGARSAAGSRRAKHLLSGLIKCGICGANHVVGSKDYYRCASVKERGTCGNSTTVKIAQIEQLALSTLQTELMTDEHAGLFVVEFKREVDRLRRDVRHRGVEATNRLSSLEAEIESLAANLLTGLASPTVLRMLSERETEAATLRAHINARAEPDPVVLPPIALRRQFEHRIADLRSSLSDPENRPEVAKVVNELIERIVIHPGDGPARAAEAEVTARLGDLIAYANAERRPQLRDRRSKSTIKVVAGTGFDLCRTRIPLRSMQVGAMR